MQCDAHSIRNVCLSIPRNVRKERQRENGNPFFWTFFFSALDIIIVIKILKIACVTVHTTHVPNAMANQTQYTTNNRTVE